MAIMSPRSTYSYVLTVDKACEILCKFSCGVHKCTVIKKVLCDPVLGNNGKMYVPESLLQIYRETIIPLANIITPNQYEAELLTGKPILNAEDAWNSIETLHSMGSDTVVITSTHLGYDNYLMAFASSRKGKKKNTASIRTPLFSASFLGTGDLFTTLFMAWMAKSDNNVCTALEKTTATVQAVLSKTLDSEKHEGNKRSQTRPNMDLKLVQCKTDIENPTVTVTAKSDADNI